MQKIDRLIRLSQKLDGIVQLDRNGDDGFDTGMKLAGGAALGIGGLKAYQAIKKRQAANTPQPELPGVGGGEGVAAAEPVFGKGFGTAAKEVGQETAGKAGGAFSNLVAKLKGLVPK